MCLSLWSLEKVLLALFQAKQGLACLVAEWETPPPRVYRVRVVSAGWDPVV